MDNGDAKLNRAKGLIAAGKNQSQVKKAIGNYLDVWGILSKLKNSDAADLKEECLELLINTYSTMEKPEKAKIYQTILDKLRAADSEVLDKIKEFVSQGEEYLKDGSTNSAKAELKFAWSKLESLSNTGPNLGLKQRCLTGLVNVYDALENTEKKHSFEDKLKILTTSTRQSKKDKHSQENIEGLIVESNTGNQECIEISTIIPASSAPETEDAMDKAKAQLCFAPFVDTTHLVCAYHLAQDNGDEVLLNTIKAIVEKDILPEITSDKPSITQGLALLACADENITRLVINQLARHIQENPLNFQHLFEALETGVTAPGVGSGDKVQVQRVLLERMNSLHAPDLAVTATLLNSMYQTLVAMISPPNPVENINKNLHIKPLKAALHNLSKRLGKNKKDDDVRMQTIKAAVKYANDTLTRLETNTTAWQKRAHFACITGELLLQAAGVGELVTGAIASDGATIGGAVAGGIRFAQSLWGRGKKIYRYYQVRKPYFEQLKGWQENFVEKVLPDEKEWEPSFQRLKSPDKKLDWLKEPAAQTALLRVLMAIYPVVPENITPSQHAILKTHIIDYFMHVYQTTPISQDDNEQRELAECVKQTAANCLLRLDKNEALPKDWNAKQLSNIIEKNQTIFEQQTKAFVSPFLSKCSVINIAQRGWAKQNADDILLYRYLRNYQSVNEEDKPEFLMAIARYTHPRHKLRANLSCWGNTVLDLIPEELLKTTRQKTPPDYKPGEFKMAAVAMDLAGTIQGDEKFLEYASKIQSESADRHAKRLNDIAKEHKLFDRWEKLIVKFDFKRWLDEGITVKTDYLRGDHTVNYLRQDSSSAQKASTLGK